MKWLIIQSAGEHRGQDGLCRNDYMRECLSLQNALVRCGQEADVWGLRHDNFGKIPDFNSYGVILCCEQYEMDWLPDFSKIHSLKLQWIIDLHCEPTQRYHPISKHCDIILHSTRSLIEDYQGLFKHSDHWWFPNCIDDRHFFPRPPLAKRIDLAFVGSRNPARTETIERLERECGMAVMRVTGHEMTDEIRSAKIHFNKNIGADLNYRNFETVALGTCLLTSEHPDLEPLGFKHGENCLVYRDDDHAVELARECLATSLWAEIGKSGLKLADRHTYMRRVGALIARLSVR